MRALEFEAAVEQPKVPVRPAEPQIADRVKVHAALRPGAEAAQAIGAHGDVEFRHVLRAGDADRPAGGPACQRAGLDQGHGNAALDQVEGARQAERAAADDYDMQRRHSFDGAIGSKWLMRSTSGRCAAGKEKPDEAPHLRGCAATA